MSAGVARKRILIDPAHDFGKNIIPSIIHSHRVVAFPFIDENRKQDAYWRDVGTLDAYFEANMDLIGIDPLLNMYDEVWPIRTFQPQLPPPKGSAWKIGVVLRRPPSASSARAAVVTVPPRPAAT